MAAAVLTLVLPNAYVYVYLGGVPQVQSQTFGP
jgi:hypothetical protein